MKIGDEQVPYICALVMHDCQQVYNMHASDSFYWCQVTMADLTGMQPQQSVYGPAASCKAYLWAFWPTNGPLHAMLPLTVRVWLCDMTRV